MKQFSQDIVDLLKEKYPDVKNLEDLSLEELNSMHEEVEDLRHEYSLLELGFKTLMNAAYGSSANEFFYFYNMHVASDITAECRNLTKTMWTNLEDFFHNKIWERKDLWKKFGFELDENMREWYKTQPISIYSDTDSTSHSSLLLTKDAKNVENKITIESLFNESLEKNGLSDLTKNNQEIVKCDYKILNWTKEKGLEYCPVKYVMRHKVSKPKFKIKTKSGKEIIVTNDHSCIVFRNGKQLTIKAKDINKDTDKILSVINEE